MDYALDDVRHFRESASATLQDGLDEARDTIVARTRTLDRAVMDLEESVRTTTTRLATSASQITNHANTAKSSLERHSKLIDSETASLATDVDSVHKALTESDRHPSQPRLPTSIRRTCDHADSD